LAKNNNLKNYGDVIREQHLIHFLDCTNRLETEAEFGRVGLISRIEINPGQFAYWKPDEAVYLTKSEPRQLE
jgi:hypothetical protein